jgi:carboxyl-terminal processing protease
MKKISIMLALLMVGAFAFQSCDDMDDTDVPVHDFIWKGLNLYYLWKDEVPNLHDDRFGNQEELNNFVQSYPSPEALFESLLYQRGIIDRFSILVPDFTILENALQGVVKSNGVEYGLRYVPGSETDVFGYVRYILPNSDAAGKDIQRGDIFYAINGSPLNVSNYMGLLSSDSYTLNLATYNEGVITPTGQDITLNKSEYAENPVYNVSVFNEGEHVIGYLMYNGFFSNYDADLNAAFGQLATQNVNELVLDLRYNSGGSVRTATYLASMITGQFDGNLFSQQQWNSQIQAYYEENNPQALNELFATQLSNGAPINSLGLDTVYILTTASTASASELIINCLKPYINVVVIGDTTVGKNVGSITLYDSPDFSRNNREGSHRYAMQPIVIRTINADGFGEYSQGIEPTPGLEIQEDMGNLGQIGSPTEPLLAAAINRITNMGRRVYGPSIRTRGFRDSKNMQRFGTEMYLDEVPQETYNLIKNLQ